MILPAVPPGDRAMTLPGPPGDRAMTLPVPPGDRAMTLPGPPGDRIMTLPVPPGDRVMTLPAVPPGDRAMTLPGPPGDRIMTLPGPPGDRVMTLPGPPGDRVMTLPVPPGDRTFHDAYLNTAVFQGFALSLMDRTMSSSVAMVMEGVGLDPRKPFIPTHLEVVQILDVSSVPHFLLSPLQCTLSLVNPQHTNSAQLFRQWFTRRSSQPDHVGFLMRLCSVERRDGARRVTSADWSNHILTRDLPLNSHRSAICSGLLPARSNDTCALRMYLMKDLCPVVPVVQKVDTGISIHDTCSGLPLLKLRTDSTVEERLSTPRNGEFADIDSAQFWKTVSGTKCEVDLSPSEWPEMQAMKTHEWIQRKLAHKSKTPDLLFGQPFPPPPSTTPENHLCVGSVLECFADDGSPMVHELSPVALQDPANMVKISDPNEVDISFESIAGTTPTSKKLIHGIHYCLTVDDLAMDARLQRLQQRCLSSERASHCFSSNTPLQERRHRLRTLEDNPTLSDAGPTGHESTGSGTRNICSGQKREGPVTRPVHARLGAKVGAVPPVRRGTKRKLNLRPQVPFDDGMGSTGNGVGSKVATRTDNDIQEGSPLVAGIAEVTGQDVDKRSQHMQEEGSANGSEFNYPSTRTENDDMDSRGAEKENTKESRKKLLEKTIVAVLKSNMPRDHPCFRLCYNRLFNLCKTFLKDVRNPEQFADEMERTVNFNVKQVIEFELRQAGLDL
ncbi:hypothetical protein EMCRGX_G024810 [Ephydatia muelleri]